MAKFSKGKQPMMHRKLSRLNIVQQAPDSDTIVPETQLEADEYGDGDYESDVKEALAIIAKNSVNKPAGSATASSQASTVALQTFGLVRPGSAATVQFNPFGRRVPSKTLPPEDAPVVKPFVNPDTAGPSIESAVNGTPSQNVHAHSVQSSGLPPSTIEEPVAAGKSKQIGPAHDHDQAQSTHIQAATVEAPRTEPDQAESSRPSTGPETTLQPITHPAPIPRKERNRTKVKKGKKTLLSKPLTPWPPRSASVSDHWNTEPAAVPSTKPVTPEPKVGANRSTRSVDGLAVKSQPGRASIPDGPLDLEEAPTAARRASLMDGADGSHAANGLHAMPSLHADPSENAKQPSQVDSDVRQPIAVAGSSIITRDPSSMVSNEAQDQHPQSQQGPIVVSQAPDNSISISGPSVLHHERVSRSHLIPKPTSIHHESYPVQQIPSSTAKTSIGSSNSPPFPQRNAQEVLHGATSRSKPIRVTKASRKAQTTHDVYSKATAATGNLQAHPRMTALDVALDTLRTACLADQYRLEDQMASKVNALEGENSRLSITIDEQLETIAEQRIKLEQSENRVVHLTDKLEQSENQVTHLTDKLKSSLKFASGLQKDHEKLQKSVVVFQEQNKRALQDQIAQVLEEKDELQGAFEAMVDSCAKSQKSMLRTMNEIQLRYVTALSRQNDLKDRLDERVAMHEEEKSRRTELEQQHLLLVQNMQCQLKESSDTLVKKISSLHASLESRAAEDGNDSITKECLLILQKLHSLPLLTVNDVHKAEGMLRYLHERTNVGFELVTKISESKTSLLENIRQCIRAQIQGLQAGLLRHDQAIADRQLAHEANESLRIEVGIEKQHNQRLEEQVASLQQLEASLKSRVTELENERDELQTAVREREAQPREYELEITQLQEHLSKVEDDLCLSNANNKRHERCQLERERQFCKYRMDALAHLANLKEHIQQMAERLHVKDHQCNVLEQDTADLRIKLESEQTKNDHLTHELSRYNSFTETLRQDKNDMVQKEGSTRALLQSATDSKLQLESENQKLSSELEEARTDLHASKSTEQKLTAQRSELQRRLGQLQDAKLAIDEQLRRTQDDMELQLQQAKTSYDAELEELESRLTVCEDARKELQAELRQMETAHKQQIECHEQKFNAKFDSLATQSQQEQEKLKTKHMLEMESCKQYAETMIANLRLDTENAVKGVNTRVDDTIIETDKRLMAAGHPTSKTLVPNTQQSEQSSGSSPQQSQAGKTRKKVDRQTNSVTVVVASNNRRLNTAEGESAIDRTVVARRRREGSEDQAGYFQEEYENRFRFQAPFQDQEPHLSLMDAEAELVPETQDFECGQGVAARLEIIESQVVVSDNYSQEESLTDLSTIPSEDLSEMLLDTQPSAGRGRYPSKHWSSPNGEMQTPARSTHDMASDAPSMNSRGRPKSRANTASRMMPLPAQDVQRQRVHADDGPQHLLHARSERSFSADNNDSRDFMHAHNGTSKRKYAQRSTNDTDTGHKGKSAGSIDENSSYKKLRTSAQASAQRPSSISKIYAPYTPAPITTPAHNNSNPSSTSVTGRRSSYRQSSATGSQGATPRLSSTRNTRSKSNRYADRFGEELDRR